MSVIVNEPARTRVRPIAWHPFVAEVLAGYRPPLRAIATWRGMKHALDQVTALADDAGAPLVRTTADLAPTMLGRLIETRPATLSPNTVRALLRYVRTACNLAIERGALRVSPFHRNPLGRLAPAVKPKGRRHFSREELRAILDMLAADVAGNAGWRQWKARRLQAVAAVLLYAGLRRNEALHLHVDDIDLAAGVIRIRPRADRRLKTERSAAEVPIAPGLVPILTGWLRHRMDAPKGFRMPAECPWLFPGCRRVGPWADNCLASSRPLTAFKAVAARAGVPTATFQMLRRSCAVHLRGSGAPIGVIAQILRHSELVDEAWYQAEDADTLRQAIGRLEF